jgi:phosphatidate cytidylyltransferase
MNFIKRTLTAAFLLPLLYICVKNFSDAVFFGIVQIVILLALIEFYQLPRKKFIFPNRCLGVVVVLCMGAAFFWKAFSLEAGLTAAFLIVIVTFVLVTNSLEKLMAFPVSAALTFFGPLYIGFTLNHIFLIRRDYGPNVIFFVLTVVFVGDTGAYLIGKFWGKHKLNPLISPKKTWEGSVAGMITGILGGWGITQVFFPELMSLPAVFIFSFVIQVAAQFSDLGESMFKRAAGVKDSSHVLPGHGGFLDRVDSLILVLPVFYYLIKAIGLN